MATQEEKTCAEGEPDDGWVLKLPTKEEIEEFEDDCGRLEAWKCDEAEGSDLHQPHADTEPAPPPDAEEQQPDTLRSRGIEQIRNGDD
jgi:hypothetical protein